VLHRCDCAECFGFRWYDGVGSKKISVTETCSVFGLWNESWTLANGLLAGSDGILLARLARQLMATAQVTSPVVCHASVHDTHRASRHPRRSRRPPKHQQHEATVPDSGALLGRRLAWTLLVVRAMVDGPLRTSAVRREQLPAPPTRLRRPAPGTCCGVQRPGRRRKWNASPLPLFAARLRHGRWRRCVSISLIG
jgi:hypothetical protein